MSKWGIRYEIIEQVILIHGTGSIATAQIETYHDHRIVMAGCVASLLSTEGQEIDDVSAIEKSYPGFIADFLSLTQA